MALKRTQVPFYSKAEQAVAARADSMARHGNSEEAAFLNEMARNIRDQRKKRHADRNGRRAMKARV